MKNGKSAQSARNWNMNGQKCAERAELYNNGKMRAGCYKCAQYAYIKGKLIFTNVKVNKPIACVKIQRVKVHADKISSYC